MAANAVKDLTRLIESYGGRFTRMTGKGHRRFQIGHMFVDVPVRGLDSGRLRANMEAEIRRAARAAGVDVEPKPRREIAKREPPQPRSDEDHVVVANGHTPPDTGGLARGAPEDPVVPVAIVEPAAVAPDVEAKTPRDASSDGALLQCGECDRTFAQPLHLGRHRQAIHGLGVTRKERPAKTPVAPSVPEPLPSTDLLGRVVAAADAFRAAVEDFATEYRLVREENQRMREVVEAMERASALLRGPGSKGSRLDRLING